MPKILPSRLQNTDAWKRADGTIVQLVSDYLADGGDLSSTTRKGVTLLHLACYYARPAAVRAIQQHGGADLQARTADVHDWYVNAYLAKGATPMDAARTALGRPETAEAARDCIGALLYAGEWRELKRHGHGVQLYEDTDMRYEGGWADDKRHGRGALRSNAGDATLLDGDGWLAGLFNGRGRRTFRDGTVWDGDWVDGSPEGRGELRRAGGVVFRGGYSGGKYDGDGCELVSADGASSYRGDFRAGLRHGAGEQRNADGSSYAGAWASDAYHGEGELVAPSGDTYRGGFHAGLRHGAGVMTYPNGGRLEASWVGGARHGCGVFTWPNGQRTLREYDSGVLVIGGIRCEDGAAAGP